MIARLLLLIALSLLSLAALADPLKDPPGLLPSDIARPLIEQDTGVAAARAGMEFARQEAGILDRSPYEWTARASGQQRRLDIGPRYGEWHVGIERTIRMPEKAAALAVVDVKGPASFPAWTPEVPQFTPSGAPARKLVDGEPKIVQTGTSPLPPEALCDAWDKFANPKFSHERGGSEINHNADLYVSYRRSEDNETVRLEAERKAGGKITRVTISSPLPVPAPAEKGD